MQPATKKTALIRAVFFYDSLLHLHFVRFIVRSIVQSIFRLIIRFNELIYAGGDILNKNIIRTLMR